MQMHNSWRYILVSRIELCDVNHRNYCLEDNRECRKDLPSVSVWDLSIVMSIAEFTGYRCRSNLTPSLPTGEERRTLERLSRSPLRWLWRETVLPCDRAKICCFCHPHCKPQVAQSQSYMLGNAGQCWAGQCSNDEFDEVVHIFAPNNHGADSKYHDNKCVHTRRCYILTIDSQNCEQPLALHLELLGPWS